MKPALTVVKTPLVTNDSYINGSLLITFEIYFKNLLNCTGTTLPRKELLRLNSTETASYYGALFAPL